MIFVFFLFFFFQVFVVRLYCLHVLQVKEVAQKCFHVVISVKAFFPSRVIDGEFEMQFNLHKLLTEGHQCGVRRHVTWIKVIRDCSAFAWSRPCDSWSELARLPVQPIRCKTKTLSHASSRVLSGLHVFSLNSSWLVFAFALIYRSQYFINLDFMAFNRITINRTGSVTKLIWSRIKALLSDQTVSIWLIKRNRIQKLAFSVDITLSARAQRMRVGKMLDEDFQSSKTQPIPLKPG